MMMADTEDNTEDDVVSRPEHMLTTVDNPYDPFTQWDDWFLWDQTAGYHTPGLLARVALFSNDLSDADQHIVLQDAIDEIVKENVLGVFRKVKRGDVAVASTS